MEAILIHNEFHIEADEPLTYSQVKYALGISSARYPVPATEIDNALAMSPERCSFFTKAWVLNVA